MKSLSTLNFPVIRGVQAGREYYVAMWTLRMLRQISIFDEKELPPELRAQRVLNKARIPEITDYILNNPRDYVFSAITASIDSQVTFEPLSKEEGQDRLGTLKVPMDAKFIINDGQHRRASILAARRLYSGHFNSRFTDRGRAASNAHERDTSAIRGSLARTRATILSLSDRERTRYTFKYETWNANQPVLRRLSLYDVMPLQESYARLPTLRTEYDVVVMHCLEFVDSISKFFDPENSEAQDQSLAAVLSNERKLFSILETFGAALASELESLVALRRSLADRTA